MSANVLVIGYGNELRRDDAVGPRVARAVVGWERPGLKGLAVHQLTPELAELVSLASRVIFVDAGLDNHGLLEVRAIRPLEESSAWGHTSDPRWLLALAQAVYGRCPPAWLIAIPVADLGYGDSLSETARSGLVAALRRIRLLTEFVDLEEKLACQA
jgi:hydrogenase maturation protease